MNDRDPALPLEAPRIESDMDRLVAADTDVLDAAPTPQRAVAARSSAQTILLRFLRHRAAMSGLVVLLLIVILAFSSIGVGPIPGWWGLDFRVPMPLEDGGRPTLQMWPFSLGDHPFGQDNIGRDYFALAMKGAQQSLIIAFLVGVVGTAVGTVIGACAGYFRGFTESVLMRATDVIITIPLVAVAAVIAQISGGVGGVWGLGIFLGLVTWTGLARIVRGEFLSLREKEFVDAARVLGLGDLRIVAQEILPNLASTLIVFFPLMVANAILLESALSFLGAGVRPPNPSWGTILGDGIQRIVTAPHQTIVPGLMLVLTVLSLNVFGDGVRDAFDPRAKVRLEH
jgi:peptide/nickel transport system permease protein